MNSTDLLAWLQAWYLQQCNGTWEHGHGIHIDTLDNPGWSLDVWVEGTPLEGRVCELSVQRPNEHDWVHVRCHGKTFKARGGPSNLGEMLNAFRRFAEGQSLLSDTEVNSSLRSPRNAEPSLSEVPAERYYKALSDLVEFARPLDKLTPFLSRIGPFRENLVVLRRTHVLHVLGMYLQGRVAAEQVEAWAELLEMRDGLEFEPGFPETLIQAIHELANPLLEGALDAEKARRVSENLRPGRD